MIYKANRNGNNTNYWFMWNGILVGKFDLVSSAETRNHCHVVASLYWCVAKECIVFQRAEGC